MDYKQIIVDSLAVLRLRDAATPNGTFKVRAYDKVIKQLNAMKGPITCIADTEALEGVGEKIRAKIAEILETGRLTAADKARTENFVDSLEAFGKIHGVGPVKAAELVNEYGLRTIEDLRKYNKKHGILNKVQEKGLRFYEDFQERIPLREMEEHEQTIMSAMAGYNAQLVGSYRRGAATSGDIDVIVRGATEDLETICKALGSYIVETLAMGKKKYMGVVRLGNGLHRRLDIMVCTEEEYPFAIYYFTGSDKFNIAVRNRAQERGYSLNEYGLTAVAENAADPPKMCEERDIFHFLGMKYVEPAQRIDETSIQPLRRLVLLKKDNQNALFEKSAQKYYLSGPFEKGQLFTSTAKPSLTTHSVHINIIYNAYIH
jgi:DNA polymerase lambda